jgi:hypothetical protein
MLLYNNMLLYKYNNTIIIIQLYKYYNIYLQIL